MLCYTLTSLLCFSCSLLRSGTLEQPFLLGKIPASEPVLEYRFGIARPSAPATRIPAGQSHHPQHYPQAALIRRPSPPISAASAHGTFELTTSLRAMPSPSTSPFDACSLPPSTRAPADHSHHQRLAHAWLASSTTSSIVFGICPVGSRALPRPHLCEARAGGCTRRAHENTRNSRPLRPVNHSPRPRAAITIPTAVCSLHAYMD